MRTRHAEYGNKWLQCECIGVIPYYMQMRFAMRIRMQQTEFFHVATQSVSAHESDNKFQGVTSLQTCFPNFLKWRKLIGENVILFRICHRGLKHAVAELLSTDYVKVIVEKCILILL